MSCPHLSYLDRSHGLVCPFCDGDVGAVPARQEHDPFAAMALPTGRDRVLEARRRIRNIVLTLAPWLATAAGVAAFITIIHLIEGATS